ncbi:MAG: hypothetical protein ACI9EW_002333, partial [Cellvibrionaceae bacterium]
MNSSSVTRLLIYSLLGVAILAIVWSVLNSSPSNSTIPISQIAQQIIDGDVQAIEVGSDGQNI